MADKPDFTSFTLQEQPEPSRAFCESDITADGDGHCDRAGLEEEAVGVVDEAMIARAIRASKLTGV
jgi:hypothetical protein